MPRLPIALSIPHGGTTVPEEFRDNMSLTDRDLFNDSDPFTKEIYDLGENVEIVISTDVYRACIDMSREETALPPAFPDGVLKSHTCYGVPIYNIPDPFSEEEIHLLIDKYYNPYHNRIASVIDFMDKDIKLFLDCHSMAPVGPVIAPDTGIPRPMICLGNRFNETCSEGLITYFAECLRQEFDLPENEVTINSPFAGGYLTRKFGIKRIPWMQIELNRALYLKTPYFDEETLTIDPAILIELRNKFHASLSALFEKEPLVT